MATGFGNSGSDSISTAGLSAGVTGGVPGNGGDYIYGVGSSDTVDGGDGTNKLDFIDLG